jgi:hypothetical protein
MITNAHSGATALISDEMVRTVDLVGALHGTVALP